MDYLKNYKLTDKDINEIKDNIDSQSYSLLLDEDKIIEIINFLISIGINNIKDIIINKSNIFYDSIESIKKHITNSKEDNIVELINMDANNFDLIGY